MDFTAIVGIGLLALLFMYSVILHEIAHGWVALRCGDPTALASGRLSLNPLVHIDPFMTIILPVLTIVFWGFPIAGARPVPVNPLNFRRRLAGERAVSVAGIAVNLVLAFVFLQMAKLSFSPKPNYAFAIFGMAAWVNLLLLVFNLMPVPPLDGSRLLRTFLPSRARDLFDRADAFGLVLVVIFAMFLWSIVIFPTMQFVWNTLLLGDVVYDTMLVDGRVVRDVPLMNAVHIAFREIMKSLSG